MGAVPNVLPMKAPWFVHDVALSLLLLYEHCRNVLFAKKLELLKLIEENESLQVVIQHMHNVIQNLRSFFQDVILPYMQRFYTILHDAILPHMQRLCAFLHDAILPHMQIVLQTAMQHTHNFLQNALRQMHTYTHGYVFKFFQEHIHAMSRRDWVLFGTAVTLLSLLFVVSRKIRNKKTNDGDNDPSSTRVSVGDNVDDTATTTTAAAASRENNAKPFGFVPLSSKFCKKAKIAVPSGMVIKSSRVWDIYLGPIKRRGISDIIAPTIVMQHKKKKSRIAFEIVGPAVDNNNKKKQKSVDLAGKSKHFVVSLRNSIHENNNNNNEQDDEEDSRVSGGDYLADDETVNVRIYRPRAESDSTKKRTLDEILNNIVNKTKDGFMSDGSARTVGSHASTDNNLFFNSLEEEVSEEDDDETDDEEALSLLPQDMLKEWISHKEYKGSDCRRRKERGAKVLEVKLGSGLSSKVRDLFFQSTEDRESFDEFCKQLIRMSDNRAHRQLKRYREMKTEKMKDNTQQQQQQQSNSNDSPSNNNGATTTTDSSSKDVVVVQPSNDDDDESLRFLIEIVSATDLPCKSYNNSIDPYVMVRMGERVIHRTSVLVGTKSPIWTVQTGSLLLLCAAPEDLFHAGMLKFSLLDFNPLAQTKVIGAVYFTVNQLLACKGERVGYKVNLGDDGSSERGRSNRRQRSNNTRLFLRIREATTSDVQFMKDLEANFGKDGVYSGETILPIRPPSSTLLKFQHKKGEESEVLHRVRPFPDPDREEETTWLSHDDLYKESMLASLNWVEAGAGDIGQLYVEILGCSNLPNMDSAVLGRKTDTFASIVFEDAAVTTDVIGETLSPRWMPWSRRAFVFNIESPSSALFVGIFDHEPEHSNQFLSSTGHEPIGRIEVPISTMEPDTIYTLAYPLYFGDEIEEHEMKERGKVWIRIRKQWADFNKAMLAGTAPAPLTVLSLVKPTDYRVVKYTTVGPRDDTGFNIWKFTEYIAELQAYEYFLAYMKDFAFNTWLWRGHYQVKFGSKLLYLPLHSMTAFFWGVVVTYDFNKLPSFFLFSIGWLFLACNEAVNTNPSPWHKCPAYYPHLMSLLLLRKNTTESVTVAPFQRLRSIRNFDNVRMKREKWMMRERELLNEQQRQVQEDLHGFEGEDQYNSVLDITTNKTKKNTDGLLMRFLFPLKPVLYPIQKFLRQVVISCRMFTSVLFWEESQFAFWITTASFVGSFVIFKIPFAFLIRWILRIIAWVFLGPWMLLADRWFLEYSKNSDEANITDEERDEKMKEHLREQYATLMDQASNYQIRKEDIVKMESMKSYMFGSHHVRVPRFRETRFKDTPLPESYAEPYENEYSEPIKVVDRKVGQRLSGDMIPKSEVERYNARGDSNQHGWLKQPLTLLVAAPSRLFTLTRDVLVRAQIETDVLQRPVIRRESKPVGGSNASSPVQPPVQPHVINEESERIASSVSPARAISGEFNEVRGPMQGHVIGGEMKEVGGSTDPVQISVISGEHKGGGSASPVKHTVISVRSKRFRGSELAEF